MLLLSSCVMDEELTTQKDEDNSVTRMRSNSITEVQSDLVPVHSWECTPSHLHGDLYIQTKNRLPST